jgi:Hydrazine synthase alpha subunit middle domain
MTPTRVTLAVVLLIGIVACASQPTPLIPGKPGSSVSTGIVFVTQVPVKDDFTTITSTFGNHQSRLQSVPRGGDLWIRYSDGSLKNLTKAAGYGMDGLQGAKAVAVRDPSPSWDGKKLMFSMVIGAPVKQYEEPETHWQLFEITNLEVNQTPVITKVPNQPLYNNVSPVYGSDDRIIFTTDRPRDGSAHLYPQRDEYEEAPVVSGLWSLDPNSGDLKMLNHAPSGDFTPFVDSFGRLLFTQWDHLQRDQQADADTYNGGTYGTFNYDSEAVGSKATTSRAEVYPEPRAEKAAQGTPFPSHTFNQFFPWMMNQDGTESEVINHMGRHELHGYMGGGRNDDPNVVEFYGQYPRANPNPLENFFQIREDPNTPGMYYGVDAPEFYTHGSGQIVALSAPPSQSAETARVQYITHRDTRDNTEQGKQPSANHSGHYRDPLMLSTGDLIASHTPQTFGEYEANKSVYDFRLRKLEKSGDVYKATVSLTTGIQKSVSWWNPDAKREFSGTLWELQPTELRARTRPNVTTTPLLAPEQNVFNKTGVKLEDLKAYLKQNNLALLVGRNVTTRDDLDKQQPFNLQVPGGVKTVGVGSKAGDKVYDVTHLQFFQGDLLRGIGGAADPRPGRRVLAQRLHDIAAIAANPANPGVPSSVKVAADGSFAAFVPATRALSWQLTDAAGTGVVRERYWLSFQPGEVRVCTSCHGLSDKDQAGNLAPQNEPLALEGLLNLWKGLKK